jgi:uncharacterized protein DUF5985
MLDAMMTFAEGAFAMGCVVLGLFFLKFWRRTRDSFFTLFACAFWLMAADALVHALSGVEGGNDQPGIYLLRLAAFVLIITAIVRKNVENHD